jgi:hypothetical protein
MKSPYNFKNIKKFTQGLIITSLLYSTIIYAGTPVIKIAIRDHLFFPSEIVIPANTKVKLLVENHDPTPEEFESYELNREKVIAGNSKTVIFVGPLPPGNYPFFGEFFPRTAQGTVTVK